VDVVVRGRSPGDDGQTVGVTPAEAGWNYVHFASYELAPGAHHRGETGGRETALIVLGGRCRVQAAGQRFGEIGGRADVWERTPPYTVLLPPGSTFDLESTTHLRLAVAAAPTDEGRPARLISPSDVVAEHRGEGQTYRYVQHLLPPSAEAARLILVEVYTPAGNWSSFPPHKHDTEDPPSESYLEETYYHRVNPPTGFALQRVYDDERSLDASVAVGDGDLVLVPRGYHPVVATPGHDSYYLNVMAGPTRAWNFRVDPAYANLMNWTKPPVADAAAR
jgi:5-deoxy-glucuronate isomerase